MIIELFSKRQRRLKGEISDVYQYEDIPQKLRVQIIHIIDDAVKLCHRHPFFQGANKEIYEPIHKILCKEYGVFELSKSYSNDNREKIFNFFLNEKSIEKTLDVIEIFFQYLKEIMQQYGDFDNIINELNQRFKENGVGYQFEYSEIIRVDSEIIHSEAVKPVLALLREKDYQGANQEFLNAHEHYRHGRYEECLVDLLKAFESTMKVICKKRGWATQPTDTANKLIKVCFDNGLIPSYLDSQLTSLRTLLESSIPTIRNKNGGHGQGTNIRTVPEYLARYALNLTASNTLFLIELEKLKP
jgi:hypothetical protein